MNTNNAVLSRQIRGRSRPFRSLLVATAASLVLTGFIVPKADATVISYFNFEDGIITTRPPSISLDLTPDKTVNDPGDEGAAGNPGGGVESSTSNLTIAGNSTANFFAVSPGLSINATTSPADSDTPSNFALAFNRSADNSGEYIQFFVNTSFWANMSLSFGYSNNGNGFASVQASYSLDGGVTFTDFGGLRTMSTGTQPPISIPVPAAVNQFGFVTFRLTFSGGFSNGNDTQTVIDNIRLDGTFVPEPATVMGGLLGVFGLCWHQRRRLVRFLRLRPA